MMALEYVKNPNIECTRCGYKWFTKALYQANCSQCGKGMSTPDGK